METVNYVTFVAIFLVVVNLAFFIFLSLASNRVAYNRKLLKYTTDLVRELLGTGGEVLTYDEEELVKQKLDEVEKLLTKL